MAVERIERDELLIRGALLPTPQEATAPLERQRAHGGLRRFPLVALLLGRDPRPAGMPHRCGGPRDARLPQERWALEAPGPPGLLPAAFGHRRHPRIFWPCGGGGLAFPWCAEGDEPPGAQTGPAPGRAWTRGQAGGVGARCALAFSQGSMASTVPRSWVTRGGTSTA